MNEQLISSKHSGARKLAIIFACLLAFIAGILLWRQFPAAVEAPRPQSVIQTQSATLLPQLKTLPPFSLTDQHGRPFTNETLQGHWTFLNFGYTHCPDICPTTLAMLGAMDKQLLPARESTRYQVAFISIDPERDSRQRLAEYIDYFEPSFLGVTGDDSELKRLTQPLGILYAKVMTENSAMGYVMDHSASIILIDPQGQYHALFSPPHDPGVMADDFLAIAKNFRE